MNLKQRLLNYLFRKLFPVVDIERVLTSNKQGKLYLNGVAIESKKLADLKQEVHLFRNTALWDIVHNTLKHQAQLMMFTKSVNNTDVLSGKMVLYTLDVQEKIVKLIDDAL